MGNSNDKLGEIFNKFALSVLVEGKGRIRGKKGRKE